MDEKKIRVHNKFVLETTYAYMVRVVGHDIKWSSQPKHNDQWRSPQWEGTTFFLLLTLRITMGQDPFPFLLLHFFIVRSRDKFLTEVSPS